MDFDGVWTDVSGQANAVDQAREKTLAEISGWSQGDILACLNDVRQSINANPLEHGWRNGDRLTAYADEDPFLMNNALITGIGALAARGDARCHELLTGLEARGHHDLVELGSQIFLNASRAYLSKAGHDLREGAVEALRSLLGLADVVFCTNFEATAVASTWAAHGFSFGTSPGQRDLGLRGNARKQSLTADPPRHEDFGGRPVALDRGYYFDALQEERPDVVVGDVFSLDLALPVWLRRHDSRFVQTICCLCRTPHTPRWSMELCQQSGYAGLYAIDSPLDLVRIAQTWDDSQRICTVGS